jgi:hypothetical protein
MARNSINAPQTSRPSLGARAGRASRLGTQKIGFGGLHTLLRASDDVDFATASQPCFARECSDFDSLRRSDTSTRSGRGVEPKSLRREVATGIFLVAGRILDELLICPRAERRDFLWFLFASLQRGLEAVGEQNTSLGQPRQGQWMFACLRPVHCGCPTAQRRIQTRQNKSEMTWGFVGDHVPNTVACGISRFGSR